MGKYIRTMAESLRMVSEVNNMDLMRKAADGAMQTMKMKDGKVKMDSFTASAIMQIYDKVNPKNKKKIDNMLTTGKIADIMKLQKFAMSKTSGGTFRGNQGIKAEYVPEEIDYDAIAVELFEAPKYDLYHKDFSSAMQHAYKMAKKLHGITVDPKEIDDKVASGPKKPSSGKTNSYRLEGDKGSIQVQVYNMDNKKYELNMYKEEVDLDEASKEGTVKIIKTKDGKFQIQKMTKGKFVDIGKPYNSQKEAEKFRSGQPDLFGEEVELDEGTWELPRTSEQKAGLKKALSKPIKLGKEGETARNVIGPFIGDDELFDDLMDAGDENPKSDARPIIKKAMKRLNIKEEVDLDEGTMNDVIVMRKGRVSVSVIANAANVKKKEKEGFKIDGVIEKGSSLLHKEPKRIMKAIKGGDKLNIGERVDPADVDTDATDDDIKSADKNIMMQMRKVQSLKGNYAVEFMNGKKQKIDPKIAMAVQAKYLKMRRPAEKEMFQSKISKSYKDMLSALKEGFSSDAQRKAAFASGYKEKGKKKKEEVEIDEGTKQVLAHGGKGKYKVVSDGGAIDVMFGGKSVGKGDFDRGADSFFMSIKGEKGQKSFDDPQAIADYFAKNKITEDKSVLQRISQKIQERTNG